MARVYSLVRMSRLVAGGEVNAPAMAQTTVGEVASPDSP